MLNSRRKSGASQILSSMYSTPIKSWKVEQDEAKNEFSFILANSLETRRSSYLLSKKLYTEMDYMDECIEYDVHDYDADPNTFTLLVKDKFQADVATISAIFVDKNLMPCYEDFSEEMFQLGSDNKKVAEVVRLCIAPEYRESKFLLSKMFNLLFIYSYRIMNYDDVVIEVKSNHARFYERILSFSILGETRPCTRVNGVSANILHSRLMDIQKLIDDRRDPQLVSKVKKNIFNFALSCDQEDEVIEYFMNSKSPMSKREIEYFGILKDKNSSKVRDLEISVY